VSTPETQTLNLLRKVSFLSGLDDESLGRIARQSRNLKTPRGHVLLREGDEADTLYIVLSGRFTVLVGDRAIAEISVGEPIGELAFFAGGQRTANVVAARDSEVLMLSRRDYDALRHEVRGIADGILAEVAARLARSTRASPRLRPRAGRNICFVPAGPGPIPMAFVEGLRAALADAKDVRVLSDDNAPANPSDSFLEDLEAGAEHLVTICREPATGAAWYRAATAIADNIYLVGAAAAGQTAPVPQDDRETAIAAQTLVENMHLVLWRDHATTPIRNSANWLAGRSVALHHHVALDAPADFARLARFVRGIAVGLVLCGGGSLGTAHIGAIKALQNRGYVFDMVGGTSVGAAMAGALAIGLDPAQIMDLSEEIFIRSKAMSRLTVPVHSVLEHVRLDRELQRHYGQIDIVDAPLNYFAVTTSLTTNSIHLLRDGPLWKAIRASGSLPGIFPPVVTASGDVLIDGGLIDNVPVSVMRDLKPGPNVVFNFLPEAPWKVTADYDALPGRLGALANLFRPRRPAVPFPGVFTVLTRAMVVNARRLLDETPMGDDILLQLKVLPGMSFLDWRQGRELFDAAHDQMVEALDQAGGEDALERLAGAAAIMAEG